MPRDGGFHPFKGRVSRHFGDSVRVPFFILYLLRAEARGEKTEKERESGRSGRCGYDRGSG
jgi:hypothetical protein